MSIDGKKVTRLDDLGRNKDRLRKFGIVRKKLKAAQKGRKKVVVSTENNSAAVNNQKVQQQQPQQPTTVVQKDNFVRRAKTRGTVIPSKHPLLGLKIHKNGLYNIRNTTVRVSNITHDDVIQRLQSFVKELSQNVCLNHNRHGYTPTSCTCLHFLQEMPHVVHMAVCEGVFDYLKKSDMEKRCYVVERMRFAKMITTSKVKLGEKDGGGDAQAKLVYTLPINYDYLEDQYAVVDNNADHSETADDGPSSQPPTAQEQQQISEAFSHGICEDAFFRLLNIGVTAQHKHSQYIDGKIPSKPEGGRKRKRKTTDAVENALATLQALHDEYVHSDECKREGDAFYLPVTISKRNFYEDWCRACGWSPVKTDTANGLYAKLDGFNLLEGYFRTDEDAAQALAEGRYVVGVAKRVISFTQFSTYWKDEFPTMKTIGRVGKGCFIGDKYGSGKWDRNRER